MKPTRPPQRLRKSLPPGVPNRLAATLVHKAPVHVGYQIKVGSVFVDVEQVAVGSARTEMPGLIRASAESGRAFLIHNARNASAATALLINPAVLEQRLSVTKPRRTLGDVIDALPFKRRGTPRLVASLPDDHPPTLRVPGRSPPAQRVETQGLPYGPTAETGA